tara:strand:+ start:696 stop:1046 length:351 start_codon:yes stop_codon:yes gene_type:complete
MYRTRTFWTVTQKALKAGRRPFSGVYEAETAAKAVQRALHLRGVQTFFSYRDSLEGDLKFSKEEDRKEFGPMDRWVAEKGTCQPCTGGYRMTSKRVIKEKEDAVKEITKTKRDAWL